MELLLWIAAYNYECADYNCKCAGYNCKCASYNCKCAGYKYKTRNHCGNHSKIEDSCRIYQQCCHYFTTNKLHHRKPQIHHIQHHLLVLNHLKLTRQIRLFPRSSHLSSLRHLWVTMEQLWSLHSEQEYPLRQKLLRHHRRQLHSL